jgi:hypothetical protein
VCRDARVLWLLWQVGMAQWRVQSVGRDLRARPMSSSRGLRILGPMRTLVSPSGSILVLLPLCFKLEHFIIYVSLCNSRIHVITLYLGHVCVYYASMLQCCHLVWILIRTDHPCLGVGCHTVTALIEAINCLTTYQISYGKAWRAKEHALALLWVKSLARQSTGRTCTGLASAKLIII